MLRNQNRAGGCNVFPAVTGLTGRRLTGPSAQCPLCLCVNALSLGSRRCALQLLERRQHSCAVKLYLPRQIA